MPDCHYYKSGRTARLSILSYNKRMLFWKEGMTPVEELIRIAEQERTKYKTIIPKGLSERITVEYKSRHTGAILWAQIGILENMLFWKEEVTYQFLEPYDSEKKLRRAYEDHKKKNH